MIRTHYTQFLCPGGGQLAKILGGRFDDPFAVWMSLMSAGVQVNFLSGL